jgi:hypothetical protein
MQEAEKAAQAAHDAHVPPVADVDLTIPLDVQQAVAVQMFKQARFTLYEIRTAISVKTRAGLADPDIVPLLAQDVASLKQRERVALAEATQLAADVARLEQAVAAAGTINMEG